MLAWLFTRLPLGNTAWEVNLLSGVFGALAVGLLAALMSSLSRWLGARPGTSAIVALSFGLAGAFSRPVWSQAVVAEVYTLHLLLTMGLVYVLYRWIRDPAWRSGYFASLLMLCLGLSNHHLTLVFVPLPLLVLFLVQRKAFLEYLAYSALVGSFVLVAFSQLSDQRALQTTATRALALSLGGLLLVMARKGLSNWRRGLLAFPVVAVGLSPLFIPAACRPNWTPGPTGVTPGTRPAFFPPSTVPTIRAGSQKGFLATLGPVTGTVPDSRWDIHRKSSSSCQTWATLPVLALLCRRGGRRLSGASRAGDLAAADLSFPVERSSPGPDLHVVICFCAGHLCTAGL